MSIYNNKKKKRIRKNKILFGIEYFEEIISIRKYRITK